MLGNVIFGEACSNEKNGNGNRCFGCDCGNCNHCCLPAAGQVVILCSKHCLQV